MSDDDMVERVARAICVAEKMNDDDALGGWIHWVEAARAAIEAFEQGLRAHLKGEHSSLTLGFNDSNGPNYMSVKAWQDEGPSDEFTEWVSEDEKANAAETNSMWTLHWYPDTPVGSYCTGASSLLALFEPAATPPETQEEETI